MALIHLAHTPMIYEQRATDDIDELFSWEAGWDYDYLQLTGGKLGFESRSVQLGDVSIEWHTYGQRLLFRDALKTDTLIAAIVVDAREAPRFAGQEIRRDTMLIHQTGREKDYVVEPGTTALNLAVPAKLVESLGWNVPHSFLQAAPRQILARIVRFCTELTDTAAVHAEIDATVQLAQREQVLTLLRQAMESGNFGARSDSAEPDTDHRQFLLVRHAQDLLAQCPIDEKVEVERIADELDVSQRTLYAAFDRWLGIGPYEYHLIRKLHAFRRELNRGRAAPGKVTQAAFAAGFQHMGQTGRLYRRHFDETPSQLLKRRAR